MNNGGYCTKDEKKNYNNKYCVERQGKERKEKCYYFVTTLGQYLFAYVFACFGCVRLTFVIFIVILFNRSSKCFRQNRLRLQVLKEELVALICN